MKQHTIPIIELYTRYTTSIWSIANELGVRTPPVAKWPTGVHLPPSAQGLKQTKHIDPPNDSNVPVKKVNAEKDVCEVYTLSSVSSVNIGLSFSLTDRSAF